MLSIFILNIDDAYEFYVNKLGFKVHTDVPLQSGYRWLTITAPETPKLEIILMPILHEGMKKTDQYADGIVKKCRMRFG